MSKPGKAPACEPDGASPNPGMGRRQFALEHEIQVEKDRMTPERFMDMTKDAYGGGVIRQLMEAWKGK